MVTQPERKPRPRPGGQGDLAGIAMAVVLATRFLGPLMRGVGPGGRHVMLLALAVVLPVGVGVRVWRQLQENRAMAALREKRRLRNAGRVLSPGSLSSGATSPDAPDGRDAPTEDSLNLD
jgi:hypothetical protein